MRVLMVSLKLPTPDDPNTMAPLALQIESIRQQGIAVDVLEIGGAPKLKYVNAWREIPSRLEGIDLIHAHFGFSGWITKGHGIDKPVVISYMGSDILGNPYQSGRIPWWSQFNVWVNKRLAGSYADVIVKSPEMAEVIAPVPAHVVPNGVDIEHFHPIDKMEARRRLGWDLGKCYVLFPGNPGTPRKGIDMATEAVQQASQLLGDQLEMPILHDVLHDDVPLYMNACDAMLLASVHEGSPNVVKEAMACDLPVVSTPVGDVPLLFKGTTGYATAPREPGPLARALVQSLQSDGPVNGRSTILERGLDLESVARKIVGIYENVLATAGQAE